MIRFGAFFHTSNQLSAVASRRQPEEARVHLKLLQNSPFISALSLVIFMAPGCSCSDTPTATTRAATLLEAREGFRTSIDVKPNLYQRSKPPADVFRVVGYQAPKGRTAAFLTPDPDDGSRHPAIIWLTGGFPVGGASDEAFAEDPPVANDQTAAAYRHNGVIMMFPDLRGSSADAPGRPEYLYGEVDDVLAAAKFLARKSYVDPKQIYLGGHSTGGTLALLVATTGHRFRAVFAFGPVANIRNYGEPRRFRLPNAREFKLRSPIHHLGGIRSPTFVIEGSDGNTRSLRLLEDKNTNDLVEFVEVPEHDHFSVLHPVNRALAEKIMRTYDDTPFVFPIDEIAEDEIAD